MPRGWLRLEGGFMRRLAQFGVVAGALGSLLTLGVPAASAGGNGAQTFTQNDHNVTDSMPTANPCTGDTGTLTETFNDVFHGTINKTGSWFTGTIEGKFTFVPDDPAKVTYAGHFATWFGDENNLRNDVEHSTFNIHAAGSDGSTLAFHENAQAAMNANGVITVSFDNVRCG
jgi:hypothetical protein